MNGGVARFSVFNVLVLFLLTFDTMAQRSQRNREAEQETITGVHIWLALMDFMGQKSKVLQKVNNVRSAAVTIIIRFSDGHSTVHLDMLKTKNGLSSDISLLQAGTP